MKKLLLFLAVIITGIGSAITYHIFENAVHAGIDLVWYDWFDTDNKRYLVVPLAIVLTLIYFGVQHLIDRGSEDAKEQGLGNMPPATAASFLKVLGIGFLSLLAGASLGPEAVLVPACMVLGAIVGAKLSKDKQVIKLMTAAGIMALMTAFFNSFLVGVLSVALVTRQAKVKISPILLITAIVASMASYLTLVALSGEAFAQLPDYHWHINFGTIAFCIVLAIAGFLVVHAMEYIQIFSDNAKKLTKTWWSRALLASAVISVLYLLGGPLVEFTGNRSIAPMFDQAAGLGLAGLLWILLIKIAVISWSKSIGYRGGMIFPTIFLAAVLVAIVQLYSKEFSLIYGLIAVLAGAFAANKKTHALV